MGTIKVHAGDFLKGDGSLHFGQLMLKTEQHPIVGEPISITELESVDIATEENVKKLGGTVGWGAAGAILLGPAGLLAGLLLGGRKKEVTFVARLKDGRRLLATTDSNTYKKLIAAVFDDMVEEDFSDEECSDRISKDIEQSCPDTDLPKDATCPTVQPLIDPPSIDSPSIDYRLPILGLATVVLLFAALMMFRNHRQPDATPSGIREDTADTRPVLSADANDNDKNSVRSEQRDAKTPFDRDSDIAAFQEKVAKHLSKVAKERQTPETDSEALALQRERNELLEKYFRNTGPGYTDPLRSPATRRDAGPGGSRSHYQSQRKGPLMYPEGGQRDWSKGSRGPSQKVFGYEFPLDPEERRQYFEDMEAENERLEQELIRDGLLKP